MEVGLVGDPMEPAQKVVGMELKLDAEPAPIQLLLTAALHALDRPHTKHHALTEAVRSDSLGYGAIGIIEEIVPPVAMLPALICKLKAMRAVEMTLL